MNEERIRYEREIERMDAEMEAFHRENERLNHRENDNGHIRENETDY